MTVPEHFRAAEDLAAYLLGSLEPEESERVQRHLRSCAECRAEVERLGAAVEVLPRTVEPLVPSSALRAEVLRRAREEPRPGAARAPARRARRPRIPALAWVGATGLLLVGGVTGYAAGRLAGPEPPRVVAARIDSARLPGASASVLLPGQPGPVPVLRAQGLRPAGEGRVYQVWLLRGRELVPSSVFVPRADGTGAVAIPEPLEGVDAVLLTRERAGGARTPSEPPLLRAPV
jgi:anti-sigma factor RsiW